MKIFDLHCDTLTRGGFLTDGLTAESLHINLDKLSAGDSLAQCFAVFLEQKRIRTSGEGMFDFYRRHAALLRSEAEKHRDRIAIARNSADILENAGKGLISAVLTVEGGEALEGKLENLEAMARDGVRMLTLTWNYENELGFSHLLGGGLKPFGKEAVEAMQALGIRPDVSHLSDEGFWDVMDVSRGKGPVVASHSCARALCGHSRNLTDEMLKALGNAGGLVGVNFNGPFLRDMKAGDADESFIEDVVRHTLHLIDKAGAEAVAWGSDFDGIGSTLEWKDFSGMQLLADRLGRELSGEALEKMCSKNALRVFG